MDSAPDIVPGPVLHVGCGGDPIHPFFDGQVEVRLDIDPTHNPDIIASMVDMGEIGPFAAVYTCHALEHLYPGDVPVALGEFHRVLKPGGLAYVIVPDLEDIKPTEDVVYESPAGPVTGLDMFYGMPSLIAGNPYMAHHCGFVSATLKAAMLAAGFQAVATTRGVGHNLLAMGVK